MTSRSAAGIGLAIVIAGFLIRLPGLTDPPLDFHPTRQYRAAVIARGYSLDLLGGLDARQRQAVDAAVLAQARIEPPVMERLASGVYHLIGREDLAWARGVAVVAWSLGGVALFWLAIQVLAPAGALTSVAVWMFLPFAILASQSFQPDPLMTALVVFTLAAGVSYNRGRGIGRGLVFGCGLGAALGVKAMSLFFLGPAILALLLFGGGSARWKVQTLAIAIVAAVPAAWYYSTLPLEGDYGPFLQLLRQPQFWRDWARILDRVVTWPLLLAALPGMLVARREARRLLLAFLAGYVAFGIVFTHHIHTHDYYSLPMVLAVALGVGALVDRLATLLAAPWWPGTVAAAVSFGCLAMGSVAVLESQRSERKAALRAEAERYERIGRLVGHSTRVLALDGSYGIPLAYHGYMLAANWPLSSDIAFMKMANGNGGAADQRLDESGHDFFVCTLQPELTAQPDLQAVLDLRHPLVERDGAPEKWAYVVYDLQRVIVSATPAHLSMFAHVGASAPSEQTVSLIASPTATWAVHLPDGSGLTVQPTEGTGPATLRVTAAPAAAVEDRTVKVMVRSARDGSAAFDVRIRATADVDLPPFGTIDAPPDPVAMNADPILFQGWALDDTSMKRVSIGYLDAAGRFTSLGDARSHGRRPDLAALYPNATDLYKAGWSFRLDPPAVRDLPRPLVLQFVAEDGSGHRAEIGRRTLR